MSTCLDDHWLLEHADQIGVSSIDGAAVVSIFQCE